MKLVRILFALSLLPLTAFAEEKKPEAAEKATKVRFKTSEGDFVVELNAEKAPITVKNFLSYVKKKHFDGTTFHRVIPSFMIQGGGFEVKDGNLVQKETDKPIQNEGQNGLKNLRGTLAMARTADPNSATSQFFINVQDNPALDYPNNGGYAVFAKVVEGMDVVDKIKAVPTKTGALTMRNPATGEPVNGPASDIPVTPVVIKSATVVE